MALNAYLSLKGETIGDIKGSVTQAGREGSILVVAVDHEIVSPRDTASGLPTGKRQHSPITIIKEVDKSSPLLYTCLTNNETLAEWKLQFWQPSANGQEQQHYTIYLTNASINAIQLEMLNNRYPENMPHRERERISFTYHKIAWVWNEESITSEDYWQTPIT